jgi:hypothetical protein
MWRSETPSIRPYRSRWARAGVWSHRRERAEAGEYSPCRREFPRSIDAVFTSVPRAGVGPSLALL